MGSPENINNTVTRRGFLRYVGMAAAGIGLGLGMYDEGGTKEVYEDFGKKLSSLPQRTLAPVSQDQFEEAKRVTTQAQAVKPAELQQAYTIIGQETVRKELLERQAVLYRRYAIDRILQVVGAAFFTYLLLNKK